MKIFRRVVAAAMILGTAASPSLANAACALSDFAGRWHAYAIAANDTGANWTSCRLVISSTGKITNTTCVITNGSSFAFTNGSIALANATNCTFTARFTFAGLVHTVRHGTLSKDKLIGNAVGTFPGGGFVFNMTRL